MKTFEYKKITVERSFYSDFIFSDKDLNIETKNEIKFLNEEGNHGWELINVVYKDNFVRYYFFKREKII